MSLSLEIDHKSKDEIRWYTNGDRITGTVVLESSTSVTLTSIRVSLQGHVYTNLTETRQEGELYKSIEQDSNCVLYDEVVVFPPSELADSSQAYTVCAGKHRYRFEFALPLYAIPMGSIGANRRKATTLPPSLDDLGGSAQVVYYVKAKVQKQGFLKSFRKSARFPFMFMPCDTSIHGANKQKETSVSGGGVPAGGFLQSTRSILQRLVTDESNAPDTDKSVEFFVTSSSVLASGAKLPYKLSVVCKQPINIEKFRVDLCALSKVRVKNLSRDIVKKTKLALGESLEVAACTPTVLGCAPLVIPEQMVPSFLTQNLERSYTLVTKIRYRHASLGGCSYTASLTIAVTLETGEMSPAYLDE